MVAPRKEGFGNEESSSSRGIDDGSSSSSSSNSNRGLTERLREFLGGESDEDLLLDAENGGMMIRWLRALDLHVVGACRADERLKPLLKLNVSTGFAEDRLLSQLNMHFDASEVGMLARCLCIPLVSIRAGKVNRQGNLLCPTSVRGDLNLSLLPSSNMRISFSGDDGCTERLGVLSNMSESLEDVIEEIAEDSSGLSFLLKLPGSPVLYFWCCEKSKDHGMKLLARGSSRCAIAATSQGLYKSGQTDVEAVAVGLFSLKLSSSTSEGDDRVNRGEHDDAEKSISASRNSKEWDSAGANSSP